jgi:HD-GYP domain-containing protein (c-di-GMP phosphodiesterase class II)
MIRFGPLPAALSEAAELLGWSVIDAESHPFMELGSQAGGSANVLPGGDGVVGFETLKAPEGETGALLWLSAEARVDPDEVRTMAPHALVVGECDVAGVDLCMAKLDRGMAESLLSHAQRFWEQGRQVQRVRVDLTRCRAQTWKLAEIGTALSAQRDPAKLLEIILTQARRLADCEAGSLYLIERTADCGTLVFKLAQNDAVPAFLAEQRLPLTSSSLAGHVALSGEELNIDDAYAIPDTKPYQFNRSFDQAMGFRTRSMLVLPMTDHRGTVIGVLQFLNRRDAETGVGTFEPDSVELLRAVASQAAVSIQKANLIQDIKGLFEGFVLASVKAIEQRDPSTSGHSFRVAETTTALLSALPRSGERRFKDLVLTDEHLTEVRYAALLHDFGKVGVREGVLVKANKLTDERLEVIRYRFELHKERLKRAAVEEELRLLHISAVDFEVTRRRVHRDLQTKLTVLDDYFTAVTLSNNPNVLAKGSFGHLDVIRGTPFREFDGSLDGLITGADLLALSVRRGSLTPEERSEIEAHVEHTRDFLAVLPWPPELKGVPAIAGAHHEKLDGSGYPDGLVGDAIPLPSRVMTVCDIFDALTAMDRPYKSSVSTDTAIRILNDEASAGLLDQDLVDIFVASRCYEVVQATSSQVLPAASG